MRIIGVADIHNSKHKVKIINNVISEYSPDVVVIAGDLTTFGPSENARVIIDEINAEKILVVPGNADPPEVLEHIKASKGINIHKKEVMIKRMKFVGFGGSPITPFGCPLEFPEDKIREELSKLNVDRNTIFVTHSPPYGVLDRTVLGNHVGSTSIREYVEERRPFLHIFGHIHEAVGVERIDEMTFVNVSIGRYLQVAIIDIDEEKDIEIKFVSGEKSNIIK
ncbi:MAG: YfcE family phosphodiesterase [Thermoplasmata archaeon]|nr:MAG: YfcE family phosphodiesterase [Thermoplasmata archaeon]